MHKISIRKLLPQMIMYRINTKLLPIKFDRLKFGGTRLFNAIQSIYVTGFAKRGLIRAIINI